MGYNLGLGFILCLTPFVDPAVAFENNKPTFLEFYAEWCEVCKEMAPKVSAFKDEYEKDINEMRIKLNIY